MDDPLNNFFCTFDDSPVLFEEFLALYCFNSNHRLCISSLNVLAVSWAASNNKSSMLSLVTGSVRDSCNNNVVASSNPSSEHVPLARTFTAMRS